VGILRHWNPQRLAASGPNLRYFRTRPASEGKLIRPNCIHAGRHFAELEDAPRTLPGLSKPGRAAAVRTWLACCSCVGCAGCTLLRGFGSDLTFGRPRSQPFNVKYNYPIQFQFYSNLPPVRSHMVNRSIPKTREHFRRPSDRKVQRDCGVSTCGVLGRGVA
jgi:hypothetical protein